MYTWYRIVELTAQYKELKVYKTTQRNNKTNRDIYNKDFYLSWKHMVESFLIVNAAAKNLIESSYISNFAIDCLFA